MYHDAVPLVAGIDLGGTAINYTFIDDDGRWLIDGLCEHPARSKEGPRICLQQIADGLDIAAASRRASGSTTSPRVGLDTPGPATADGVLSSEGSTNFVHHDWRGFDIRSGLETKLGKPVTYLNDGNAGALWGHFAIFGADRRATSISAIVGTGLGGGVIVDGNVVKGRKGFGGELGHVLIPYQSIDSHSRHRPGVQLRTDRRPRVALLADRDRQDAAAVLPDEVSRITNSAGSRIDSMRPSCVRGRAERGDPMCRDDLPRPGARARAVLRRDDQHLRPGRAHRRRRRGRDDRANSGSGSSTRFGVGMPRQREEQADIPIHVMPNGDSAGARGAAIEALKELTRTGSPQSQQR